MFLQNESTFTTRTRQPTKPTWLYHSSITTTSDGKPILASSLKAIMKGNSTATSQNLRFWLKLKLTRRLGRTLLNSKKLLIRFNLGLKTISLLKKSQMLIFL